VHPSAKQAAKQTANQREAAAPQEQIDMPLAGAPSPLSAPSPAQEAAPPAGAPSASAARTGALRLATPAVDRFSEGKDAWLAHDFARAIQALGEFLAQSPQDPRAPEARFLLADAYRAAGRFAEAASAYAAFLRQHADHARVPDAFLGLGESRVRLGDRSGCGMLREAVTRYPKAPEAGPAREALTTSCP
jgi:TolA-binding protein